MAYSDKVLDHYENPRNVGTFDGDKNIGTPYGLSSKKAAYITGTTIFVDGGYSIN